MKRPNRLEYLEKGYGNTRAYEEALEMYIDLIEDNERNLYFGLAKILVDNEERCIRDSTALANIREILRAYKPVGLKK